MENRGKAENGGGEGGTSGGEEDEVLIPRRAGSVQP